MLVVCSNITIKYNLEYQIVIVTFLGHAKKHIGGTYHMLNMCKKRVVLSRDVIWVDKTYGD